ncbi:hypothetical protein GARC_1435 [Paraglaciecola arctica BSs20135]|uniref:Uncharacterized protein n=1 Tax=Paraglaciecola arctica BSs20135 TaxID=493475 RepID=K6Z4S0_9ALTE|nr:hypothetical protein GARC_1435 [Paraglaciecola arctica BSs20135]
MKKAMDGSKRQRMLYLFIKSTLRAIIHDGFCLESFRASYSFY